MFILTKIIGWVSVNIGGVFGISQAIVKAFKEIVTVVINIFFPLFPDDGKFERFVLKTRDVINVADEWLQKIKDMFLKVGIKA